MRYVYLALLLALAAMVFMFKFQNLETVTVQFLSASVTLPLSVLLLGMYVLGMLTGGVVWSLIRNSMRGATTKPPVRD
ncbi:MAG TPA: LapA family protein [Rubrivivax sp.]|nr:LapA family protein [Rubrivivax sp.]